MKGIIIVLLFLLGATVLKAQDELIATKYSIDGKNFQILKKPVSIILDNTRSSKAHFKLIQANKTSLYGFLEECRIVKSNVVNNVLTEVRKLIVVENGNKIKHEFMLILYSNKRTKVPFKFSLLSVKDKKIIKTYQGEI